MPYYAHSGKDDTPARSDWQLLRDHLLSVGAGPSDEPGTSRYRGDLSTVPRTRLGFFTTWGNIVLGSSRRLRKYLSLIRSPRITSRPERPRHGIRGRWGQRSRSQVITEGYPIAMA